MISKQLLKIIVSSVMTASFSQANAQSPVPAKPRVLISTDIGGTDPDDNQSMAHLLMYTDKLDLEGIVSSPSFGNGSADEIRRMISIYEKDYPVLRRHCPELMSPRKLRRITKQGHRGLFPLCGFAKPTEGSKWIVRQARQKSDRPLWVLVWGSLEDVAQALHDAPDIAKRIRVYYIGGPNKKWGVNSYAYIAANFPDLWIIENNASYRGIITNSKDTSRFGTGFYDYALKGAGNIGADFINYYKGIVKMGDSPSLLYMLDGDPNNPTRDSWGGSFTKMRRSPCRVFDRQLTLQDTIPVYSVIRLELQAGNAPADSKAAFTMTIDKQQWTGESIGNGRYAIQYSPKAPGRLTYTISSPAKELDGLRGEFVVSGCWPGSASKDDYILGDNWHTDRPDAQLFDGKWQGAKTVSKHRAEFLADWASRLEWLK